MSHGKGVEWNKRYTPSSSHPNLLLSTLKIQALSGADKNVMCHKNSTF